MPAFLRAIASSVKNAAKKAAKRFVENSIPKTVKQAIKKRFTSTEKQRKDIEKELEREFHPTSPPHNVSPYEKLDREYTSLNEDDIYNIWQEASDTSRNRLMTFRQNIEKMDLPENIAKQILDLSPDEFYAMNKFLDFANFIKVAYQKTGNSNVEELENSMEIKNIQDLLNNYREMFLRGVGV